MWSKALWAIMTAVLILGSAGPARGKQRYAMYSDRIFRFSFHYPANWIRDRSPVFDALFTSPQDDALVGEETIDQPMDHTGVVATAINFYNGVGTLLRDPDFTYRTIHGQTYVASSAFLRSKSGLDVVVQLLLALFTHHTFLFVGGVVYSPCRQPTASGGTVVTDAWPVAEDLSCKQSNVPPARAIAEERQVDDSLSSIVFWP